MNTIYRQGSTQTRVEFKKDATGKIGAFMLQGDNVLACKWYKNEKSAIKWANEVL